MTRRLYYTEPYRTRFDARVVEQLTWNGRPAVVLDQTVFYPASGGQPADQGKLDGDEVVDVTERDTDGAIVHVLSRPVRRGALQGHLDWERRFDHMQQHTGQHILSAAFLRELNVQTIGFHLGAGSSTIDVDQTGLRSEDIDQVELVANAVIWDDRPITARFVDAGKLAELDVEPPPHVEGPIRLLVIPGGPEETECFDVNPCGGTHVARSGEIGMLKIVGAEHRGDETRIAFLCGRRALQDYRDKNAMLNTLASRLTVGYWELDDAVERLEEENRASRRAERELRQQLLDGEADQLVNAVESQAPYRVVGRVWESRSPDEIRTLARKVTDHPGVVALLFSVGDRVHFCFARSDDVRLNVNDLLQKACTELGGKGGGRPNVAQGSAPAASVSNVSRVLDGLLLRLDPR